MAAVAVVGSTERLQVYLEIALVILQAVMLAAQVVKVAHIITQQVDQVELVVPHKAD